MSKSTFTALKKGKENDIILSHVHPNTTGFSRADIDKLVNYKSIRALTLECPDGTKYILERGSFKSSLFGYYKYDSAFSKAEKEAQAIYPAFESNDEKELEKIWEEYVDTRNQLLAKNLGMIYRRVNP